MNPLFTRMTKRDTPPMNREVMEGLAVSTTKQLEEYLDAQIRSICEGLPSCIRYVNYERCTPEEEFYEATKLKMARKKQNSTRPRHDLAKASVYMVKFNFEFDEPGHPTRVITRHVFLPFVTRAGIMYIGGTQYHIVPVLSDKIFTPNQSDTIFVRLMQDKNNMHRIYHTVYINDKRESCYVIYATIYRGENKDARAAQTTRAKTTLTHYLLGKYGFSEMFMRYAGFVPVLGDDQTVTEERYPKDKWVIVRSTGLKPITCIDRVYRKSTFRLAIPIEHWNNTSETLAVGFFYVIDHFPQWFEQNRESVNSASEWKILIGHIRFSGNYGVQRLHSEISEHYESLDSYLDTASKRKLFESQIYLENYYDLLNYVQVNFNKMLRDDQSDGRCVYGKSLEVLSELVFDILYGFVILKFKLCKSVSRKGFMTLRDAEENIRRSVRLGAIYKLSSRGAISEAVSYSGDNMYPKVTAIIAEQESRSGGKRGSTDRVVVGPKHRIDLSMLTTGSVLNLPKSDPTPMVRVNPWITLDPKTNTVLPNEKLQPLIDKYKSLFKLS